MNQALNSIGAAQLAKPDNRYPLFEIAAATTSKPGDRSAVQIPDKTPDKLDSNLKLVLQSPWEHWGLND